MNIAFFTRSRNENIGSYRIWINDLSRTLNECGNTSKIYSYDQDIGDIKPDIIILGKSVYSDVKQFRNRFKDSKIGAINVSCDFYDDNIDFVIVGSPEEMCSLSRYDNVFMYPLIERQFENIKIKNHTNTDNIRICFHGHYPHLSKFEPFLKLALENLSSEISLELVIITGDPSFEWNLGKPDGITVEMYGYDKNTISEIIQSCDIGVVPNVSDIRTYIPAISQITSIDYGLYTTDYFLRFKNKTNGGRAYVFYQHGIPVIHDISPSSFEFMSKTGRYVLAHDNVSWEKQIRKLYNKS